MFLNKSCFSQKTKETPKDHHLARNSDKQTNSVRLTYGVLAVHQAGGLGLGLGPEKIRRTQIEEAGKCRQLATPGRAPSRCSYSWSLGFRSLFNLKLPPVPLRLIFRDLKYSSMANSIGLNSESSGESLSGFMSMTCAFSGVSTCCSYLVFLRLLSRSFNRQASITHAEKFRDFSSSRAAAICSSILYEKRMFFVAVLLVFDFFGMATLRVVWCFVDNFRQVEVNVIDLYQDNLSELTQDNSVKKHLRTYNGLGYVNPAPHKTGAGRCNPKFFKATPDAESVFFVVRYMCHSMAWYVFRQCSYNRRSVALLAYHAANNGVMCSYRCAGSYPLAPMSTPRRQRMVALAGLPKGRPVSLKAGIATPVNVTALFERCNSSGDSLNNFKEAA